MNFPWWLPLAILGGFTALLITACTLTARAYTEDLRIRIKELRALVALKERELATALERARRAEMTAPKPGSSPSPARARTSAARHGKPSRVTITADGIGPAFTVHGATAVPYRPQPARTSGHGTQTMPALGTDSAFTRAMAKQTSAFIAAMAADTDAYNRKAITP